MLFSWSGQCFAVKPLYPIDPAVKAWADAQLPETLHLRQVTLAEIRSGIERVIEPEDAEQVAFALDLTSRDIDFADALHVAACREAGTFYSFDRRLIRQGAAVGITITEPKEFGP